MVADVNYIRLAKSVGYIASPRLYIINDVHGNVSVTVRKRIFENREIDGAVWRADDSNVKSFNHPASSFSGQLQRIYSECAIFPPYYIITKYTVAKE